MIHVICLNPAVDKLFAIDGFAAGEDYPGQTPVSRVGGKGVNVARVLSQLGESPTLYAFLGEAGGESVRREMESRCACRFLTVPGACRTTINIIDRKNDRETVITEAGPCVSQADVRQLLGELEAAVRPGDIVCCSGSIIAGAPAEIYAQIAALAKVHGARCVLDCNAKALATSLPGASYALGKPNERELAALLGEARTQDAHAVAEMARRLMPPYDALLVSMGAAGGVLAQEDAAYVAAVPKVDVVSTVGSGDACFAGAIFSMAHGDAPQTLLARAMACGAVNAALGQVGSVKREMVGTMMENIQVQRI